MKYKFNKKKLKEDIDVACIIAKCLVLADFEIDEKIYEKLSIDEQCFFKLK